MLLSRQRCPSTAAVRNSACAGEVLEISTESLLPIDISRRLLKHGGEDSGSLSSLPPHTIYGGSGPPRCGRRAGDAGRAENDGPISCLRGNV